MTSFKLSLPDSFAKTSSKESLCKSSISVVDTKKETAIVLLDDNDGQKR